MALYKPPCSNKMGKVYACGNSGPLSNTSQLIWIQEAISYHMELESVANDFLNEFPSGVCHDLAKRLSHYLYFFSFLFLFFYLGLTTQREVWESVMSQVSHSHGHMTGRSHHMMSHDRCGKIVHRPCSSCISSVENLTETLLSSLCQSLNKEQLALFWLGV